MVKTAKFGVQFKIMYLSVIHTTIKYGLLFYTVFITILL